MRRRYNIRVNGTLVGTCRHAEINEEGGSTVGDYKSIKCWIDNMDGKTIHWFDSMEIYHDALFSENKTEFMYDGFGAAPCLCIWKE